MKGHITNIEKETLENTDYRRVIYTSKFSQLVLMCIMPGDEIGEEVHNLDQFLRIEEGNGKAILDNKEHAVSDNFSITVPSGTKHNIINTGKTPLKLYTIYSPPNHKDGIVQKTKADEREEHFDGVTTE